MIDVPREKNKIEKNSREELVKNKRKEVEE
jgi:hypothetical protein